MLYRKLRKGRYRMSAMSCEPPSPPDYANKMEKLDIVCQIGNCEQPAAGFIRYPEDEITLAACQGHIRKLCPPQATPTAAFTQHREMRAELLTGLSRSDSDRLYKEARQWDEWLEQQNDPHGTVCRDAAAVAAPADNLPPRRDR
jgi:hypothetical protein